MTRSCFSDAFYLSFIFQEKHNPKHAVNCSHINKVFLFQNLVGAESSFNGNKPYSSLSIRSVIFLKSSMLSSK